MEFWDNMKNKNGVRSNLKGKKRGMEFTLVNAILGVAFIIGMVIAAPVLLDLIKNDIDRCRLSASLKATSIDFGSLGTRLSDPVQLNIDCHTKFLTAKKDGFFEDDKRFEGFNKREFKNNDLEFNTKKAIGNRMAECWYMFGNGKIDYFSKLSGDSHCIECYEIKFDEEVKEELPAIEDFEDFLVETNYKDTTYATYLFNEEVTKLPEFNSLETGKTYAVTYFRSTASFSDELAKGAFVGGVGGGCILGGSLGSVLGPVGTVAGAGVGCAGGLVLGIFSSSDIADTDKTMGVTLVPLESLGSSCRKLY
jgi:hypothetical protein